MAEEEKLSLEVVAPEKMVMSKTVDMVTISGTEGAVSYTHLTLPTIYSV